MTHTIYLLNYNNYYNRTYKEEATLADYLPYQVGVQANVNFHPGDHISTTITVNIADDIAPDYVIVVDETNTIVSHWFLIEANRKCQGQWIYQLYRDVVVDFKDTILDSPCFIEKALIPENDSAIYNSEEMTFNRIKTAETPIKDATQTSWLVAYLARDADTTLTGEITPPGTVDIVADRESWVYKDYIGGVTQAIGNITDQVFSMRFAGLVSSPQLVSNRDFLTVGISRTNTESAPRVNFQRVTALDNTTPYIQSTQALALSDAQFDIKYAHTYEGILNYLPTAAGLTPSSTTMINNILGLDGLTIKFTGENTIYKIQVNANRAAYSNPYSLSDEVPSSDPMFTFVQNKWTDILPNSDITSYIRKGQFYAITFYYTSYSISLIPQGTATVTAFSIPVDRVHLEDAPYDMVCAPYDNITIKTGANTTIDATNSVTMAIFSELARKNAGGDAPFLLDIQRLPYCPIANLALINGQLDATRWNGATQMFPITQGNTNVGAIFACSTSNFRRWIPLEEPIVINNKKIQSQCDMYRLCSPNYNGAFDFDPAMNEGLTGFNVFCTYKPFNPYIQVSPYFNGLYGDNFNDSRGLICGGEWSMPLITNAWETYERQNANYLNTFNRQIENMKVTHKVQRQQDVIGAIAGTLQGVASGAGAGMFIGSTLGAGPIGGAIGGAIGAVASSLGGFGDVYFNELLRNEAIDYTMDQFGYQLGNIQALPNSLARTSAFTINNKIFPFLEYYTCTNEEKEALANKIAHNGMTLMRIGKIRDYVDNTWSYEGITARNYIKGKIIKCENLEDEYHVAKTISRELNEGIYFGG